MKFDNDVEKMLFHALKWALNNLDGGAIKTREYDAAVQILATYEDDYDWVYEAEMMASLTGES